MFDSKKFSEQLKNDALDSVDKQIQDIAKECNVKVIKNGNKYEVKGEEKNVIKFKAKAGIK